MLELGAAVVLTEDTGALAVDQATNRAAVVGAGHNSLPGTSVLVELLWDGGDQGGGEEDEEGLGVHGDGVVVVG